MEPWVNVPTCDLAMASVAEASTVMVSLPIVEVMPAPLTVTELLMLLVAFDATFTFSVSLGYALPEATGESLVQVTVCPLDAQFHPVPEELW